MDVGFLLRYGILLWGNSGHAKRALIPQKQCVRAICNADILTSCRALFKQLKLLTVPSMYIYEVCLFVKLHPELYKTNKEVCKFNTRYPNRLVIPAKKQNYTGKVPIACQSPFIIV